MLNYIKKICKKLYKNNNKYFLKYEFNLKLLRIYFLFTI